MRSIFPGVLFGSFGTVLGSNGHFGSALAVSHDPGRTIQEKDRYGRSAILKKKQYQKF
jgi:hypothetical protein